MSSTAALRRSLRSIPTFRRHASRTPAAPRNDIPPLPADKLRALVALYNQAHTFVTPENLSSVIDYAFITAQQESIAVRSSEDPYYVLEAEWTDRQQRPKLGGSNVVAPSGLGQDKLAWSDKRSTRERAVIGALYGVESGMRPSAETLEEEAPRIRELRGQDKDKQ